MGNGIKFAEFVRSAGLFAALNWLQVVLAVFTVSLALLVAGGSIQLVHLVYLTGVLSVPLAIVMTNFYWLRIRELHEHDIADDASWDLEDGE